MLLTSPEREDIDNNTQAADAAHSSASHDDSSATTLHPLSLGADYALPTEHKFVNIKGLAVFIACRSLERSDVSFVRITVRRQIIFVTRVVHRQERQDSNRLYGGKPPHKNRQL